MSSIRKTALDLTTLPAALLPLAKSHLRVDGTYDDAYITSAIARGISWFERVTNVSVNPVTWLWSPDMFVDGLAPVPVSPVNQFTVDAGDGDISDDYLIVTLSTYGVGIYALSGIYAAGMVVTIPTGYADAAELDPGILDAVLRYTAHLYENREILVMGSDATTPGWMNDTISTYWMPRV